MPQGGLIACADVQYDGDTGVAACVVAEGWRAERPLRSRVERIHPVALYVPGRFFERELPCLLAVLEPSDALLTAILIDGHVWLDHGAPGLGAHLHESLGRRVAVVGVAKTAFRGSAIAQQVLRGTSRRPLYVTAAGIDPSEAAEHVRTMHGDHRIPTLLSAVDRLARRG